MKGFRQGLCSCFLMIFSFKIMADAPCTGIADCLPLITENIQSLVANAGYSVTPLPSPISQALLDMATIVAPESNLLSSQLGAITVVALNNNPSSSTGVPYNIVPSSSVLASYNYLNASLNAAFTAKGAQVGSNPNPPNINPAQNAQIDQLPYQGDPTSQTLFNMLSTPPTYHNCPANGNTCLPLAVGQCSTATLPSGATACPSANAQVSLLSNAIPLPPTTTAFYDSLQNGVFSVIPEVNLNILLAPLVISPSDPASAVAQGAVSVQQANSFIRYVTGTMIPAALPNMVTIKNGGYSGSASQQAALQTYIASYRTYVAQMSVALSNFYYLLSKRLPQSGANGTSQALNEYNMATWRLTPAPGSPAGSTPAWINAINAPASAATVQKEMAILLAEMNYQLYLNRQDQERLLSTISVLLILNTKAGQPNADALEQALSAGGGSGGGGGGGGPAQ
ncbi:MAG: hypothetical protein NTW08_05875 [Gammaproteobacteria bacterium]|nr:hypothetical protein [Gammaproteobacteria bacterium]